MSVKQIIQLLLDKGMKHEDISDAFNEMSSYFHKIAHLEGRFRKEYIQQNINSYRGRGNEHADIVVISDKPNIYEQTSKYIGFSDYALYLTIILNKIGVSFYDVYWTCAVKEPVERLNMKIINEYSQDLDKELQILNPAVIIALGTTAISALAKEPIKIEKAIGEKFFYETKGPFQDILVIPLRHPSLMFQKSEEEFKAYTKEVWKAIKPLEDYL